MTTAVTTIAFTKPASKRPNVRKNVDKSKIAQDMYGGCRRTIFAKNTNLDDAEPRQMAHEERSMVGRLSGQAFSLYKRDRGRLDKWMDAAKTVDRIYNVQRSIAHSVAKSGNKGAALHSSATRFPEVAADFPSTVGFDSYLKNAVGSRTPATVGPGSYQRVANERGNKKSDTLCSSVFSSRTNRMFPEQVLSDQGVPIKLGISDTVSYLRGAKPPSATTTTTGSGKKKKKKKREWDPRTSNNMGKSFTRSARPELWKIHNTPGPGQYTATDVAETLGGLSLAIDDPSSSCMRPQTPPPPDALRAALSLTMTISAAMRPEAVNQTTNATATTTMTTAPTTTKTTTTTSTVAAAAAAAAAASTTTTTATTTTRLTSRSSPSPARPGHAAGSTSVTRRAIGNSPLSRSLKRGGSRSGGGRPIGGFKGKMAASLMTSTTRSTSRGIGIGTTATKRLGSTLRNEAEWVEKPTFTPEQIRLSREEAQNDSCETYKAVTPRGYRYLKFLQKKYAEEGAEAKEKEGEGEGKGVEEERRGWG